MPRVFLSIGSNINPERHIPAALKDIQDAFGPLEVSSTYESEAVGFEGPIFHNLVASFHTELSAEVIAKHLRAIEERHGRTRESQKFSSRTLDIDLILWGDAIFTRGRLEIPRPEITRYAFVLEPLAELAPRLNHPQIGKTYEQLWSEFDHSKSHQKKLASPQR